MDTKVDPDEMLTGAEIVNVLKEIGLYEEEFPLIGYYLPLLHLYWSDGEERGVQRIRQLAIGLAKHEDFLVKMIRDVNWRPVVVGNAVAIILRKTELQRDMLWRLKAGIGQHHNLRRELQYWIRGEVKRRSSKSSKKLVKIRNPR